MKTRNELNEIEESIQLLINKSGSRTLFFMVHEDSSFSSSMHLRYKDVILFAANLYKDSPKAFKQFQEVFGATDEIIQISKLLNTNFNYE